MRSSFSWLDYSEHERRKMFDVIRSFDDKDTRDELGIGTIRDAFSDLLFPGTSTIQTRAGYFLFVPWIYRRLEQQEVPSAKIEEKARKMETQLIYSLMRSRDTDGVIGKEKREDLKRLPSNVYWQGLGRWGIRLFNGSQDQYHRSLDRWHQEMRREQRNDDNDSIGDVMSNWHDGLPEQPADFPDKASFRLRRGDAGYLLQRVLHRTQGTLMAFLASEGKPLSDAEFIWQAPEYANCSSVVLEHIVHAHYFSEIIHGAALIYNLMLAEKLKHDSRVKVYRQCVQKWSADLETGCKMWGTWDLSRFWGIVTSANPNVPRTTRCFVDTWLDMFRATRTAEAMADEPRVRVLIQERERHLKKGLARLENRRALELWSGAAGTRQLDFRWAIARRILNDILEGIHGA